MANLTWKLAVVGVLLSFATHAQTFEWAKAVGGANNDEANGVTVDGAGFVHVVGNFLQASPGLNFNPGGTTNQTLFSGTTNTAAYIGKYSADALNMPQGFRIFTSTGIYRNNAVIRDGSDNIYMAGIGGGSAIMNKAGGFSQPIVALSSGKGFIAKYDADYVPAWAIGIGPTSISNGLEVFDLAVDASGNVYAVGQFQGTTDFGVSSINISGTANCTPVSTSLTASGLDAFVVKYNSQGCIQWAFKIGSSSSDAAFSIDVDNSGNIYVGGLYRGLGVDMNPLGTAITVSEFGGVAGSGDAFLAKYNANGICQWAFSLGVGLLDQINAVSVDPSSGDVYVAGMSTNDVNPIDLDPSGSTASFAGSGLKDAFIAKYSTAGAYQWHVGIGSTADDEASSIYYNTNGVYLTGSFSGTSTSFGSSKTATSAGGTDAFFAKYTSAGVCDFVGVMGGTSNERGKSISAASDGKFYIVGSFDGGGDFDATAGTSTLTNAGGRDIFMAAYSSPACSQPSITTQPSTSTVCTGTSASFTVAATTVSGTLAYQWKKAGATISGATSATYTIPSVVSGDAASYTCEITNGCSAAILSNAVSLNVNNSVTFSTQPSATAACIGGNASMSVTAAGSGTLSYQWKRGTTNVGTNASSISFNPAAAIDAGSYTVEVTGTCGTVTSSAVLLTINTPVTISVQPAATAACIGGNASMSVTATGSGTLSYQWKRGTTNVGTNASIISFNPAAAIDAGSYTVDVTGTCGTVTSSSALLTINTPVTISAQPSATAACIGGNTSMSVTATGSGTLSYQWKRGTTNVGTNASSISFNPAAAIDAGSYTVDVTGTCGTVTSSAALLTINTPVTISAQPAATSACIGGNTSMSVTAAGTGTLSYQWKRGTTNVGTNASSISFNPAGLIDAGSYTVDVNGTCGTVTSNVVILSINSPVSISTQPSATVACIGGSASLTVTASGSGTLSYQWKRGTTNVGTNASSISFNPAAAIDAGSYTVDVTGTCGTVTSSAALLTINTPVTISVQPSATAACIGGNASMSVTASGSGTLNYQWKRGTTNVGTNASSISFNPAAAIDAGSYTVDVTGTCGTITSGSALLTINEAPQITTGPVGGNYCSSSNVSLSVVASGATPLNYQWKKDGSDIFGANTSTFSISSLSASNPGSYSVLVSNSCGNTLSSSTSIGLLESPTIVTPPSNAAVCNAGENTSLSVLASGIDLNYQWKKGSTVLTDGGAYSGVNSSTLNISVSATETGSYTVVVSGTCSPSVESSAVTLSISSVATVINTQPSSTVECIGQTATLSVSAVGASLTYQWKKGGNSISNGANISGAQTSILTITSVSATDAADYTCDIFSTCAATITSSTATLSVIAPVSIITQPASETWCSGVSNELSVVASGGGTIVYQWSKDGSNLSDGSGITGSSASTVNVGSPTGSNAGNYAVRVSNSCNFITSSTAVVSVGAAPSIINQPTSISACSTGTLAVFAVSVSGSGLTYQWKKDGVNMSNGGNISGVLTNTLTITSSTNSNEGDYTVEVGSTCGSSLVSNVATFSINSDVTSISVQPFSQSVCSGSNFSLAVTASGNGLSYQWRKGGIALSNGTNISGSTSSILSISPASSTDAGSYTVTISSACAAALTSSAAVVQVNNCTNVIAAGSAVYALYPNPALERFTLKSDKPVDGVTLISSNGAIYILSPLSESIGESQWDISILPAGIYEVKAISLEKVYVSRIAIVK
jgi:hypothetical protein